MGIKFLVETMFVKLTIQNDFIGCIKTFSMVARNRFSYQLTTVEENPLGYILLLYHLLVVFATV